MASYTEKQRTELIEKGKAFQLMRRKQIDGMYKVIQFYNIARITILLFIIGLIIFM